jgi:hypothetical protein
MNSASGYCVTYRNTVQYDVLNKERAKGYRGQALLGVLPCLRRAE